MTQPRDRRRSAVDVDNDVLTAAQAAALLGVKPATLYAYVSRGLLRSRASPGSQRKRYLRADVVRLQERADAHRGHAAAAKGALNWGAPVVESAITRIDDDGPRYRGFAAAAFWEDDAGGDAFARCGRWLARGSAGVDEIAPTVVAQGAHVAAGVERLRKVAPPTSAFAALDLVMTAWRLFGPAGVLDEEREWQKALLLRGHLCAAPALLRRPAEFQRLVDDPAPLITEPIRVLRRSLALPARHDPVLARILVVLADHELNASTFAARVTASTGATLAASLTSALATLSGPRHGAAGEQVEALFAEVGPTNGGSVDRAAAVVAARLGRGEVVPGFGHRLYAGGDPRCRVLLELPAVRDHADTAVVNAVVSAWQSLAGSNALSWPTVDIGLVAACGALGVPRGTATALFAIARSAGWIAHIFEQRRDGAMLRPRARYIGS